MLHLRWTSVRTGLPQGWRKRRIQGTGSLGDLGRPATGRTRATRARRSTARAACADVNCNCKGGHPQIEGEVLAPPGLHAKGQDGEWEMKVSKKNQKSQKQRKREQAGRAPPQGSPTTRVPQSSLKMFKTIEPDHVKAVNADDGWEEIEFALDSRATQTVMGQDMLSSVETKEGAVVSKRIGELIPNLGEKKFQAVSEEGVTRSITAQVCAVNKALMSVKKVMRTGNRVVFDEARTYIEDSVIGAKIWATDDGGMFMVKMWVNRKAGFKRQENELEKARDP